jgi:hypothetical protein
MDRQWGTAAHPVPPGYAQARRAVSPQCSLGPPLGSSLHTALWNAPHSSATPMSSANPTVDRWYVRPKGATFTPSDRLVGRRPLAGDRRVVARAHARGRQQRPSDGPATQQTRRPAHAPTPAGPPHGGRRHHGRGASARGRRGGGRAGLDSRSVAAVGARRPARRARARQRLHRPQRQALPDRGVVPRNRPGDGRARAGAGGGDRLPRRFLRRDPEPDPRLLPAQQPGHLRHVPARRRARPHVASGHRVRPTRARSRSPSSRCSWRPTCSTSP